MQLGESEPAQGGVYRELEQAVYDLSSRGLHQAARWAAEQMAGLDEALLEQASRAAEAGGLPQLRTDWVDRVPQYMLARQHFEFKEYRRAASVLGALPGPKALFFKCWCLYLAGEKRKEEERDEVGDTRSGLGTGAAAQPGTGGGGMGARADPGNGVLLLGGSKPGGTTSLVNQELHGIEASLNEGREAGYWDPFCEYLMGLVLLDRGCMPEAQAALLRSVNTYPANWGAWQALQRVVVDANSLRTLPTGPHQLPLTHWAAHFFIAAASLELQENMEALSRLQRLSHLFPQSLLVEGMVAQAHYNLQNFEEAQVLYEDLLSRDPYRLEGADTFSNILFVREQPAALSLLAHRAMTTDKFRPETCCVVGNYYSLKGAHEQAVAWFRRALRLQRSCLAAWTLMGHEYMEMKNTAAAIEAYRAAVELCANDYRAWYGLGQAHELLKLPYYALYYYRRAAALRPDDARMWCALGQCYASPQVGNQELAVRCYQRAVDQDDPEGIALHLLAKLREARGELDEAERLYRADLARLDAEGGAGGPQGLDGGGGVAGPGGGPLLSQDAVDALLFLAGHCKATGRLGEARAFCDRLMDVGGAARERAKALAREITAVQALQRGQGGAASATPSAWAAAAAPPPPTAWGQPRGAGPRYHHPGLVLTSSITPHASGATGIASGGGSGGAGPTTGSSLPVAGRNLMSAWGLATAAGSGVAGGSEVPGSSGAALRQGRGPGTFLTTPLPAPPLFGGITPTMASAGLPAGLPPPLFGGHGGVAALQGPAAGMDAPLSTPLTCASAAMSEAGGTPPDDEERRDEGWAREADGAQGAVTPPSLPAATPPPIAGSPTEAAGVPAEAALEGGTPGVHTPRGGWEDSNVHVAAVAQQLRVVPAHAAALLAAAGGDPVQAIRQNLHLLGPLPQQ